MTMARDIMQTSGRSVAATDSVRAAARTLYDSHLDAVPVCDAAGNLAGMLHCRDILGAVASGQDPASTRVGSLVAEAPASLQVSAETPVEHALIMMAANQIDQLPVFDHGAWVGTISHADLARSFAD